MRFQDLFNQINSYTMNKSLAEYQICVEIDDEVQEFAESGDHRISFLTIKELKVDHDDEQVIIKLEK